MSEFSKKEMDELEILSEQINKFTKLFALIRYNHGLVKNQYLKFLLIF